MNRLILAALLPAAMLLPASHCSAQITPAFRKQLQTRLGETQAELADVAPRLTKQQTADIAVCLKAVDWALRHNEFPRKDYGRQADRVLDIAGERIRKAAGGQPEPAQPGAAVQGYKSEVDQSWQPYCVTLPQAYDPESTRSWPLYVRLHGRSNDMNEVNFFHRYHGKAPAADQDWIQLDVYGRGNNAYRWAGEVDVFEALRDVKRRYRIDEDRITLHGFSMGGAGAWHLGVHYPHLWASVGAGAGFVDFYKYQKQNTQLPPWQHATLGIYDAIDYALNTSDVPVCTYGGEKDAQLLAGKSMTEAAARLGISVRLLIGPGMGHKFDPKSQREFMAFLHEHSKQGRPRFGQRKQIRFTTRTLKYNQCDWLTIEEMQQPYAPTTVEAVINDDGVAVVTTANVAVLRLARGITSRARLDGIDLPLESAADGLLPDVYYEKGLNGQWTVLDYATSKRFPDNSLRHKRHDLQGPIDDAFTQPFVCVRGTGTPWSPAADAYATWSLQRFEREWDKWMRGQLPVTTDDRLSDAQIAAANLILFGDPGSNAVIARIAPDLPVTWTADALRVGEQTYPTSDHTIALIFPNPLNPRRYVVINSGHTFHERDFRASNSWLFPRLGDGAVLKFQATESGYSEKPATAWIFDQRWKLPAR